MDKANQMIEEIYDKWAEYTTLMDDKQTCNFMLHALAVTAVRERDRADWNEMALKRCEITRR
jgi:hypothetical protein